MELETASQILSQKQREKWMHECPFFYVFFFILSTFAQTKQCLPATQVFPVSKGNQDKRYAH